MERYLTVDSNGYHPLVGKRARIKHGDERYARFLWGVEGTIEANNTGVLFLNFDNFAYRTDKRENMDGMPGVMLEEDCFEVIG